MGYQFIPKLINWNQEIDPLNRLARRHGASADEAGAARMREASDRDSLAAAAKSWGQTIPRRLRRGRGRGKDSGDGRCERQPGGAP
jgi:hypothetical protein